MKTNTSESRERIIKTLIKPRTANEVIDKLFVYDMRNKITHKSSWKYYVHLNKLFSIMESSNLIKTTHRKLGATGRFEKVWERI